MPRDPWRDTRGDAVAVLWAGAVDAMRAEQAVRRGEPLPDSPSGRRHGYDLARLAWDSARRTCVECGGDCGVSVDCCDRCGYPVCRGCGPLRVTNAGDVTVTCAGCEGRKR